MDFALIDHIIEHHIYKTDKEANKYCVQNTNSLQIKSCFLDGLTLCDMYCMITLKVSADFALLTTSLNATYTRKMSSASLALKSKTKPRKEHSEK